MRPFPPGEVSLLTSFAAHAAVALENARLFEQARAAWPAGRPTPAAGALEPSRSPPSAHDRLTDVLLHGGGVAGIADVLADVLGGPVAVFDERGPPARRRGATGLAGLARRRAPPGPPAAASQVDGRVRRRGGWPATSTSAPWSCTGARSTGPDRRTLERGALVTALVLLFGRTVAEAEERVRGELLSDLLERPRPRRGPGCASGPGDSTPTSTARWRRGRRVEGLERHRAARVAARLGARSCSGLGR